VTIQFNPEEAAGNVLPEGKYPAVIEGFQPGNSKKSGAPYLKAAIRVYGGDKEIVINDILMLEGDGLFRLKNLASACGMKDEFATGKLDESKMVQQSVTVVLGIEEDDTFGDRNRIKRYEQKQGNAPAPAKPTTTRASAPKDLTIKEEDIPF
jgi:hypothetical protein